MDADKLMQLADNKYRLLKERDEWDAPSAEEEKIMALQAAVDNLTKRRKKRPEHETTERDSKKQSIKKRKQNPQKPNWMNQRPPEDELHKPRKWNGNEWWYCHPDTGGKCDGQYRRQKTSDCEGRAFRGSFSNAKRASKETDGTSKDNDKRLKVAEALATVVDDHDDENTSDGYES